MSHPALYVNATALKARDFDITTVSNNLANVNTVGFKKGRAIFADLAYQNVQQPGAQSSTETVLPSGLMIGTGVKTIATQKIYTQGNVVSTDNSLDVAINGDGFFQILRSDGTIGYTRDGRFQLDSQGRMVTSTGFLLQPEITIAPDTIKITISSDGIVSTTTQGSTTSTQVGQIQLATFINPAGLENIGDNLLTETTASGTPTISNPMTNGAGSVLSNAIEESNVNAVEEMVKLLDIQHAYEISAKGLETTGNMLEFATQRI